MLLNNLRDIPGTKKKSRRIGRGIGSGRGKTSGRGGKGQTARSGVSINGFEGGQMPLVRRLPKVGFTNIHRIHFAEVNLGRLQQAIDRGLLSVEETVTSEVLRKIGFFKKALPLKVLGEGELTSPLKIESAKISASAKQKIEACQGSWKEHQRAVGALKGEEK